MKPNTYTIEAEFDPGAGFVTPLKLTDPKPVDSLFTELKERLLEAAVQETETVSLHVGLRASANEAAAMAWLTPFPLLVFPQLFAEKIAALRLRNCRQDSIKARSEQLLRAA